MTFFRKERFICDNQAYRTGFCGSERQEAMKNKLLSIILVVTMAVTLFTGCDRKKATSNVNTYDVSKIDFKTNQQITNEKVE